MCEPIPSILFGFDGKRGWQCAHNPTTQWKVIFLVLSTHSTEGVLLRTYITLWTSYTNRNIWNTWCRNADCRRLHCSLFIILQRSTIYMTQLLSVNIIPNVITISFITVGVIVCWPRSFPIRLRGCRIWASVIFSKVQKFQSATDGN